ncbi:unnamed protein product [Pylaiella littoralis]
MALDGQHQSSVAQSSSTDNVITLRGSTDVVTDFFYYAVNSVLYQRGVYHPDSFARVAKYGITTLVTTDEALKRYLDNVIKQLKGWLLEKELQRLVLVIIGTDSGETLERWTFNVHKEEREVLKDGSNIGEQQPVRKSEKVITKEIQGVIRQITSSVTFLPLLDEPCSFDLLVYTKNDAAVPRGWNDSDPRCIKDSSEVVLKSFSTKIHKVDTVVSFKIRSDEELC